MSNTHPPPVTPWYEDNSSTPITSNACDVLYFKPKDYYRELSKYVFNQTEAVKQASLFLYSHINLGCRRNILFSGSTGSGKSWLIQNMRDLVTEAFGEPNLFSVADASAISSAGYRGNDVQDAYANVHPIYLHIPNSPQREIHPIVVFDEFDKIIAPNNMDGSFSSGFSKMTMNSFLMALSGCDMTFSKNGKSNTVNTSNISHILVGSFQDLIDADTEKPNPIGFNFSGEQSITPKEYSDDFFSENLQGELWGRIDSFSTLNKMSCDDYVHVLKNPNYIKSFEHDFHVKVHLTDRKIKDLAELAEARDLGVRTLNSNIKNMILESFWEQENTEFIESIPDDGFRTITAFDEIPFVN